MSTVPHIAEIEIVVIILIVVKVSKFPFTNNFWRGVGFRRAWKIRRYLGSDEATSIQVIQIISEVA